jgi:hypothetical protein
LLFAVRKLYEKNYLKENRDKTIKKKEKKKKKIKKKRKRKAKAKTEKYLFENAMRGSKT